MGSSDRRDAKRLFTGAIGFAEAARGLASADGLFHWPAFYVNLGLALELALKSYCRIRGTTEADLASKTIGHDLSAALVEAERQGFQVGHPGIRDFVAKMSAVHKRPRDLRYLLGDELEIVDGDQAIKITMALIRDIGRALPVSEI